MFAASGGECDPKRFNDALCRETTDALRGFIADPEVRAVLFHGEGRAFSAGFDLKESAGPDPTDL